MAPNPLKRSRPKSGLRSETDFRSSQRCLNRNSKFAIRNSNDGIHSQRSFGIPDPGARARPARARLPDLGSARERQTRPGLRSLEPRLGHAIGRCLCRAAAGRLPRRAGIEVAPDRHRSGPALEHSLQMRSGDGHRKVAIVAEADRLQPQAANAFLKTLEEPPNDSLLIL